MPIITRADISEKIIKECEDEILAEIALNIAHAESNFNPLAKNPNSTASGIFQFLKGTWKYYKCEGEVFNEDDNIKCGVKILRNYGVSDWEPSKHLWYKNLSPEAKQRISFNQAYKQVFFMKGIVQIDKWGNILDGNLKVWRGGENVPFL